MAFDDRTDILLDSTGDLVIDSDIRFATGLNSISQGIRIRILTFFGEWFLNKEIGVRWFEDILGQPFDQSVVMSTIRDQIIATPNVLSIESLTASYESSIRTLKVNWKVNTIYGLSAVGSISEVII